jgi:hypothetical protein
VALVIFDIPAANSDEGDALIKTAQEAWKWKKALREPQS